MIDVKNLHKSFGQLEVLKDVSQHIDQGECVVIIGPSGSGKSTFLRCLNMLETPTSGDILFDGVSMVDPKTDLNRMRQKMGMVFQHFNLFPNMTILKNMTLAPIRTGLMTRQEAEKKCLELLERVDTLLFSINELEIEAVTGNLPEGQAFVNRQLEEVNCPPKAQMQIELAVEEIFVNIASYAYGQETGMATIRIKIMDDTNTAVITFIDSGIPFNPLDKEDPDVTLKAEERNIGGLGIYMTKKSMDDLSYEYKDGQNILTITKRLQ